MKRDKSWISAISHDLLGDDLALRRHLEQPLSRWLYRVMGVVGAVASVAGLILASVQLTKRISPSSIIIGLACVVVLILIGLVYYHRRALLDARLRWLRTADPALVYAVLARTFGAARDTYHKMVTIAADGSAELDQSYDLRAVTIGKIESVEQQIILAYHPDESASEKLILPTVHVKGRKVTVERLPGSGGRVALISYRFDSPVRPSQGPVHIEIKQMREPPGTYAPTRDRLSRWQEYEYSSVMPHWPCNNLKLEIRFAEQNAPTNAEFDVWFGDIRKRHEPEYRRLSADSPFDFDRDPSGGGQAVLTVPFPVPGVTYAIRWHPPA